MIKAQNIYKTYGSLQVLKGVNMEIARGEVVSIVGASGAGKTTLLQIVGTLEHADAGYLEYDGQDITRFSAKQLARFRNENLGFIFQFHHLMPEFTALENVCIPAYIAKKGKKEAEAAGRKILDFMGLSERLEHKPSELSGGEQQRVAVARALINQPKVVLADEPTGNLDSKNAQELHRLFNEIRREFNTSFVIITHNNQLADTADRKLTMQDGLLDRG